MEELYRKSQQTILTRARHISNFYGVEYSEAISVANEIFVSIMRESYKSDFWKFKKNKSTFNTFLYNNLNWRLMNWAEREQLWAERVEFNSDLIEERDQVGSLPIKDDIVEHITLNDDINHLSSDAKEIIKHIFSDAKSRKISKKSLMKDFKKKGWKEKRIKESFADITKIINQ